ncbi:3-deoxy-D-manno-octulosonic acid transferase [Algimonas porphyrae]|uniref:3-deoxy-D-manno-octulosonic acid transferase n=1 Tax=Algimonas porphyrae TaxID=1128113 RepID=A0ABQ5UZC2_9PROT|nr:3-deoxy-D-manno-octulosonic acid transferase [Algimonas porphyrae]GLQ19716.1 3-deoxy-D-manno-octulosonic acid transferase [Algimonas porphyrae]
MINPLQTPLLYRVLTSLVAPVLPLWLRRRAKVGKEDGSRLQERYGRTDHMRPPGELIWLHGASVGETQMLRPLIDRLLEKPDRHILVTSGTTTSADLLDKQLPDRAIHQYLPVDTPRATARFVAYWFPTLAIFAESELWPNLIWTTERANVPLALVNARMSNASLHGWSRRKRMARSVIGAFNLILPADSKTAKGLSQLLDRSVPEIGSLKLDAPALAYSQDDHDGLRRWIGDRPAWLAASTHEAEENVILDLFQAVRAEKPDSVLIWLPRHPERGEALTKRTGGAQRSKGETPRPDQSVYVMDTMGEMGLALSLVDVCVLGGSFAPELMGHNPLEAARAGVPVITGPHLSSFADLFDAMAAAEAVIIVEPDALADAVLQGLDGQLSDQARTASDFAEQQSGVLDITVTRLEELIARRYMDPDDWGDTPS